MRVSINDTSPVILDDSEQGIFRVHRSAMTSPEILNAEFEGIFDTNWLYIGHESEIPKPGDYVSREVAGRPLIFVRNTKNSQIGVFHNSCTHRGALICRQDKGNAKAFQCFYHDWTFNTNGDLVGVPDREGYGPGFDMSTLGLKPVPRLESYRGFVFVSFDVAIEDLPTYLAGAREYLDLVIDESESNLEIIPGTNVYSINANWKLLVENSIDGYHAGPTHKTYFNYLAALGTDIKSGVDGIGRGLGNGHAVIDYTGPWGRPIAKWEALFGEDSRKEIERLRTGLVERYGEERASHMADHNRNLFIYPNLIINDIMAVTVRTFMPVRPDLMMVMAWELAPSEESADLRKYRLDSFLTFIGPGGFATPDDVEALESCQVGFRSGGVEWSDISRGMARAPRAVDEEQMRSFWRRWKSQVTPHVEEQGVK